MNTKRGVKRVIVVALGLAAFVAWVGTGPFRERDAITTHHQDGSKRTIYVDGSASDYVDESHGISAADVRRAILACIKNKTNEGIGDPIVVDRQACPTVVSMEWVVMPPFYREPIGLVIWTLLFGVPLFFAGQWAVRGFRVEPLETPCPWCGKMTPTRHGLQELQRAHDKAGEEVVVLMHDMCRHCGLGIGNRFG
jgi:hypothetical protein